MLANFLSGLRILLVPLLFHFISQGDAARWQTVLLLLFAAATDLGDGLVARHFGQTSRLGKILDPLADKIFLACLLGALVFWRGLPLWLLGMLFARDLVIVLVGGVLFRTRGLVVAANRWGKYTTACMGFMALSHILQSPAVLRDGLIGLAAVMVLVSSASYALFVRRLLAPIEQQTSP
ncbi:MAG TPA: CDP-alcohol phosphatidyltransferase family protein [Candidatus Handelsmanbacteria bacterium]|nr:CDP-alcohol phosphatidyltransferase family protein [Candidatus Handelsmanbacteria bacterium]